jgi:DNA-binding beta-propeller fold protein YncE
MDVQVGSGEFTYTVHPYWGRLPAGWSFGDVAAVAVDSQDRVFVFNRGPHPMVIFDRDGEFLGSWGEGVFPHAHGLEIAADGFAYCTDDGDHTVRKCTLDGQVLLELGTPGVPAPFMGGLPFNRCTQTAVTPSGDIYVSDGYHNNRVHRFSADGELLASFGSSGVAPGEFNFPHSIAYSGRQGERLYVADRENHRIQIFDLSGTYLDEWRNLYRPASLCQLPGERTRWLVGEIGAAFPFTRGAPNLGPRLSVLDGDGVVLARIGVEPAAGTAPGQFLSPHGLAVDSRGDVYVAQPALRAWGRLFRDAPVPDKLPSLQKLVRTPA